VDFLRRLLGGGRGGDAADRDGMYFYIKARRTGEVIKLRLNRINDLSLSDDMESFYVRKQVVGRKSFDRIEAEMQFDKNRRLISATITGGDLVTEADYNAYLAAENAGSTTPR